MKGTKQFPQCGFSNTCVQARPTQRPHCSSRMLMAVCLSIVLAMADPSRSSPMTMHIGEPLLRQ